MRCVHLGGVCCVVCCADFYLCGQIPYWACLGGVCLSDISDESVMWSCVVGFSEFRLRAWEGAVCFVGAMDHSVCFVWQALCVSTCVDMSMRCSL